MRSRCRVLLAIVGCGVASSMGMVLPPSASAYRTTGDVDERVDQPRLTWRPGTVSLYVDDEGATGNPIHAWDVFASARERWNDVACSAAQLELASSEGPGGSGDGHNSITWRRWDWEEAGLPADAPGVTDVIYERDESGTWWLSEVDVLLNARDFEWSDEAGSPDSSERSVEAVLTHELGHVLGLAHEPDRMEATMFPSYTGPDQATLSDDDRAGLCFLYPRGECGASCAPTAACIDGVCESTCGGRLCRGDAQCVDGACTCGGWTCGDGETWRRLREFMRVRRGLRC